MKKDNIDVNILAHTKWDCKYHIVFAPQYRIKVFYEEKNWKYEKCFKNYVNGKV